MDAAYTSWFFVVNIRQYRKVTLDYRTEYLAIQIQQSISHPDIMIRYLEHQLSRINCSIKLTVMMTILLECIITQSNILIILLSMTYNETGKDSSLYLLYIHDTLISATYTMLYTTCMYQIVEYSHI